MSESSKTLTWSADKRPVYTVETAATYLGIPKGRLDRWCREGVVTPTFYKTVGIPGVGPRTARMFTQAALDGIKQRLVGIAWWSAVKRGRA